MYYLVVLMAITGTNPIPNTNVYPPSSASITQLGPYNDLKSCNDARTFLLKTGNVVVPSQMGSKMTVATYATCTPIGPAPKVAQ